MKDIYEFLRSGVFPPDAPLTILEIGAHVGSDSVQLRRMFPKATLICFEPDPRNVYEWQKTGLNRQIRLVEAAVGDTDGTAELQLSGGKHPEWKGQRAFATKEWTQSSSLKRPTGHLQDYPWVKFGQRAKVRVVRLDTFTRTEGIGPVDFVWADTQGAEDLVIAGGQETLARTRYLFTEYTDHPWYEGQIGLDEIVRRLPGRWEIVAKFAYDALLRNASNT